MSVYLVVLFILSAIFSFFNGFHDSSNIVATIISSRAMSVRRALLITALSELAGAVTFGLTGAAVAQMIGKNLVHADAIRTETLIAALIGAIVWSIATWLAGIPSSSSHTLIGGLLGATWVHAGLKAIEPAGFIGVLLALILSPVAGLVIGYLFTRLVFFLARNAHPRISQFFNRSQIVTGIALGFSHGANDPQKPMGVMALGLLLAGFTKQFELPWYVIAIAAGASALGTGIGGWKLIRTIGSQFYKIRPVHGFSAQVSSALVIFGSAILGLPVSTTQVISSAVLGAGSAQRVNMVRWGVVRQIAIAWLVTIPMTALIAAGAAVIIK